LKKLIEKSLDADKALDITLVDLAGKSSLADYMIVASGTSQKHIATLADHLVDKLEDTGFARVPVEGKGNSDWVVIDAGSIIVHLFRPEARQHYNLEKMWGVPELSMEAAL
jgi:ribosome-associated protein